jgi:lipopolysaccharide transport system ATP-binding protein
LEVGTGFHPEMTGRENIYLNGTIMGMTRREITNKLNDIVDFAGVSKYVDTPVKRYSSGMKVRLGFAVAAFLEPEILIVDEVLAVGDYEFQSKAIGKIEEVSRSDGRTVLFVSHNMASVRSLCEKTVLFQDGRIAKMGYTSEIINSYLLEKNTLSETVQNRLIKDCRTEGLKVIELRAINNLDFTNRIISGEDLIFEIHYVSEKKFMSPSFVFQIKDVYGTEVIRLSNMPISGYQLTLLEKGCLRLIIKNLPLVKGRYYVDFGFVRERINWYFKVENLITLDVEGNDVYQSGFELDRSRGLIWVDHNWVHSKD